MEAIMTDQAPGPALPEVVDRRTWQEAREKLFDREKAHTREGDAIAAARRRLPMVEVDATIQVIGPNGPIIHSRDVTYATLCKGPYEESVRYRDFLGLDMPWYSVE